MALPKKPSRNARKRLIVSLGQNLDLDVELAARQNLAVVANSGGGKTKALRLLIEALIPHMAVVVFDTAGEFWTLCEHFECLLVGPNGQLPADPEIAADLARFIREKALRVVVDLSRLEEDDQQLFVERFVNALLKLPDTLWGTPIAVVIDEVHLFAPQEERPGSRKSVGNLTTLGRKQGIFSIVATQSLAETSKKILGSINNRLYGRFAEEPDLMRASRALGFKGRKEWATIESFEPGDFYAKGGAWISAKPIVRGHTNNKTISTHIDQSTRITSRPPPASASVRALATELAKKRDEIAAAKAVESAEIDVLRKRIRELEAGDEVRRLRARVAELEKAPPVPRQPARSASLPSRDPVDHRAMTKVAEQAVRQALGDVLTPLLAEYDELVTVTNSLGPLVTQIGTLHKDVGKRIDRMRKAIQAASAKGVRLKVDAPPASAANTTRTPPPRYASDSPQRSSGGKADGGKRRLLIALAQHPDGLSLSRLAIVAGFAPTSGTYRNYRNELRADGQVQQDSGTWTITSHGLDVLGSYEKLPTGPALVDYWLDWLGRTSGKAAIVVALLEAGEAGLDLDELATKTSHSMSSGTFRNYRNEIRALGLISKRGKRWYIEQTLLEASRGKSDRRATRRKAA